MGMHANLNMHNACSKPTHELIKVATDKEKKMTNIIVEEIQADRGHKPEFTALSSLKQKPNG